VAIYRALNDLALPGSVWVAANSMLSDAAGGNIPVGWTPPLSVEPLDMDAAARYWTAGPIGMADAEPTRSYSLKYSYITPAPATYWTKAPGYTPDNPQFILTGIGAVFGPRLPIPQTQIPTPPATGGPISSAGVFTPQGKLVRTIWVGSLNDPRVANPAAAWDGTDDNNVALPAGNYTVMLIQHNIQWTWDGVVGNTSPLPHNNMVYHNEGSHICSMAITAAGEMYYTSGYNERWPTANYTTTANPQVMNYPLPMVFRDAYGSAFYNCTDGIIAYYGNSSGSNSSAIWGVHCSDKSIAAFSSGVVYGPFNNAINVYSTNDLSGMAVQRSGNFLFATNFLGNFTRVLNKTTGAPVNSYTTWSKAANMATNPQTGDLWLAYSISGTAIDTIIKITCDSSGNLTGTATSITGFSNVIALAISPDGTTLLVVDGGSSHQVKAFNTSNGSVKTAFGNSGTFGDLGGYANGPQVSFQRFAFWNASQFGGTFGWIAFASDGSWWLGDRGNNRSLHFSAGNSPTYIEQIAYLGGFYSCQVSRNEPNPTVFGDYLEFAVDYTKPLSPTNGSWTLLNNWGFGQSISPGGNNLTLMRYVGTYSNGRRYAQIYDNVAGGDEWYELTSTGLRSTHSSASFGRGWYYDANMNKYFTYFAGSDPTTWTIYISEWFFTGFDGSNNPTWSATARPDFYLQSVLVDLGNAFPPPTGDANIMAPVEPLANGTIPIFQIEEETEPPNFYPNLGGLNNTVHPNPATVSFTTYPKTPPTAGGTSSLLTLFYPLMTPNDAKYFANSGGVTNAGGQIVYQPGDHVFFTQYRGEPWGNNQTNFVYIWHQSGLMLQNFGKAAPYFAAASLVQPAGVSQVLPIGVNDHLTGIPGSSPYSFKGMEQLAGNAAWGGLAVVGGNYYLYHNDEWYHGGIHRWTISNLNTVLTSVQSITFNGTPTVPNDPTDLLQGLPYGTVLPATAASWTRNPVTDTHNQIPWWHVYTNGILCDPHLSPDICCECTLDINSTATLTRPIPRVGSGNWSIHSTLYGLQGSGTPGTTNPSDVQLYIDILDNSGKRILHMANAAPSGSQATFYVNDVPITPLQTNNAWSIYIGALLPFNIVMDVGTNLATVTYGQYSVSNVGVYDVGASPTNIATLQLKCVTGAGPLPEPSNVVAFTKLHYTEP